MTDPTALSVAELSAQLHERRLSAREALDAHLGADRARTASPASTGAPMP